MGFNQVHIMSRTAVMTMVLSGLCFLPSCFPRFYILVTKEKTWTDARSYCREKYTDLASVNNEQDLAQFNNLTGSYSHVWIGLHADTEAWKWSLDNQDYYGEGEAGFRMWVPAEPNAERHYEVCVSMINTGKWVDTLCTYRHQSICYNGAVGSEGTSSSFIFVNELKTWKEAQSYCREHYTDLASVRNQAENEQIKMLIQNDYTWIGLYRDSWEWSDGSAHSLSWPLRPPSATPTDSCMASLFGVWNNSDCANKYFFACHVDKTAPVVKKQVVRVVLKKTDSSVDMEELKEDILERFNQSLKEHSLSQDVTLRWVEQPDGKVFHKKATEKKKKKSCALK